LDLRLWKEVAPCTTRRSYSHVGADVGAGGDPIVKKYFVLFLVVFLLLAFAAPALAATGDPPDTGGVLSLLQTNVLVGSLLAIVALVILDVLVTAAVAVSRKTFDWSRLLDFLRTNVIPYVICWGAIEALFYLADRVAFPPDVLTPFVGMGALIYALIIGRLIASILGTFKDLGIPAGT
jgi:hypothetical protein